VTPINLLLYIFFFITGSLYMYVAGIMYGEDLIRAEAVENRFASWAIQCDGISRKFEWRSRKPT